MPTATPASDAIQGRDKVAIGAWGLTILIGILGIGWMIATPPGIFSDSVSGFLVMRSMEKGAPFNHEFIVDTDNIEFDQSEFKSWWTPGQYLVPMLWRNLGLDLGSSLAVTVVVAWLVGTIGFWQLWRRLGFSKAVSAGSVAVIVAQPYVLGWGRFYHGGALLEWSFVPWFTLAALHWRALSRWQLPILAAAIGLGVFFKSSFVIVGGTILAGTTLLRILEIGRFQARSLLTGLGAGGVMAIALAGFAYYTSLGKSPTGQKPWGFSNVDLRELFFAGASPIASLFDVWQTFIPNTESVQWEFQGLGPTLVLASLVGGALVIAIVRFAGTSRAYTSLLLAVYGGTVLAYFLAWTLDLLISFNVRHFRVAGLFIIPGALALLLKIPAPTGRAAAALAVGAACLASAFRFTFPSEGDSLGRPVGPAGFSHIYASQAALDTIEELDGRLGYGNHLIGVPWPQMALDVQHSRVYDMRTGLVGAASYHRDVFFGEVDNLILIVPIEQEPAIPGLLRAFRQHHDWRRIHPEIEDFVFMHSGVLEENP